MLPAVKRWLFLTHRWLGIVLCAFFAMWFGSGIVMMYVGYPKLTEAERLAHLPPLDASAPLLGPAQALRSAEITGPLTTLRLAVASGGRPVYLAAPVATHTPAAHAAHQHAGTITIDALTGARLDAVDASRALASANAWAHATGSGGLSSPARYLGTVGEDAFSHTRSLDPHRPLHRVQLDDASGTLLYISSLTGEVVRDAPRTERLWNYAGAWIHWLYPLRGNRFDRYWADVVNWLSIAGIVVAITGTTIGILRWRFGRPYRSGSRSPYTSPLMKWHHVAGLMFAAVTLTWIFSGLMSMNPWRIFSSDAPALQLSTLQGQALAFTGEEASPRTLLAAARVPVRELAWVRNLGELTVQGRGADPRADLLDARTARPRALPESALRSAAATLLPAPLLRIEVLQDYDLYYYERAAHTMTGGADRPLPVWRLVFDDASRTWVHLDPHTGTVLNRLDTHRRASRWLFAMLHSWDWVPLLQRRPLWDLLLLSLAAGGAVLSVTGVVIGWRRVRRQGRQAARTGAAAGRRRPDTMTP